jgi:hypothetical protein
MGPPDRGSDDGAGVPSPLFAETAIAHASTVALEPTSGWTQRFQTPWPHTEGACRRQMRPPKGLSYFPSSASLRARFTFSLMMLISSFTE